MKMNEDVDDDEDEDDDEEDEDDEMRLKMLAQPPMLPAPCSHCLCSGLAIDLPRCN